MEVHGLIDIDDFSLYNSNYGFEEGNKILEKIPLYIRDYINPTFFVKIGSDEFLFSTTYENSKELRTCVSKLMESLMAELKISVSVGLTKANYLQQPSEILSRLKSNVLISKKHGKNLICEL